MSEKRNGIVHESQNILWKCCSINQHTHAIIQSKALNFELNFLSIKKFVPINVFLCSVTDKAQEQPSSSSHTFSFEVVVETALRRSPWVTKCDHPRLCGKAVRNSQSSYFRWGSFYSWPRGEGLSEELLYNVIVGARSLVSWEPASCSRFLTHCCKWRHLFNTSHKTQALSAGASQKKKKKIQNI